MIGRTCEGGFHAAASVRAQHYRAQAHFPASHGGKGPEGHPAAGADRSHQGSLGGDGTMRRGMINRAEHLKPFRLIRKYFYCEGSLTRSGDESVQGEALCYPVGEAEAVEASRSGHDAGSSNGRTRDFGSRYPGSNPGPAATFGAGPVMSPPNR